MINISQQEYTPARKGRKKFVDIFIHLQRSVAVLEWTTLPVLNCILSEKVDDELYVVDVMQTLFQLAINRAVRCNLIRLQSLGLCIGKNLAIQYLS